MNRHHVLSILFRQVITAVVISLVFALAICGYEWWLNPGEIYFHQGQTQWWMLIETLSSWWWPLAIIIFIILMANVYLRKDSLIERT